MKLIASDLDGTLLISHEDIGEENLKALHKIREKGITFVASTGRALPSAKEVFDRSNFTPDYIISCNGTLIFDGSGNELKKTSLPKETAKEVLKYLHDNNYSYAVSCEDTMYSINSAYTRIESEYNEAYSNGERSFTCLLKDFHDLFSREEGVIKVDSYTDMLAANKEIYSIICLSTVNSRLMKGMNDLNYINNVTITQSSTNNFEIFHEDASKGAALEFLTKKLNISLDDTMALGDNLNDLSMLEKAKISVAMDNARSAVKEKCTFVTKKNTENGVAHAINHFLNI